MYKNLLVMVLMVIILAMAVPFTMYIYQTENAFTYDNVISSKDGQNLNVTILP